MSIKSNKIRVAIAQISSVSGNIEANMQKHLDYIKRARKEKADVLLFPELSLCGSHVNQTAYKTCITYSHPYFQELTQATGDMASIVGFAEEGAAAQFYNSSIILQQDLEPFIHRKMNLCTYGYWEEAKYFAQGRYLESFKLSSPFKGAILICADMWNPALVHLATLHGATVIFSPAASGEDAVSSEFSNPDNWELTLRFYAMMYGMPVVMANLVGRDGDLNFWGGSCVVDPFGKIQEQLGREEEGMLVTDLDYSHVRKARFELPTVRDSNYSLIQREMQRIAVDLGIPVGLREEDNHYGRKK